MRTWPHTASAFPLPGARYSVIAAEGLEKEEGKSEERRTKEAKRSWIDEEIARSRKAKRY